LRSVEFIYRFAHNCANKRNTPEKEREMKLQKNVGFKNCFFDRRAFQKTVSFCSSVFDVFRELVILPSMSMNSAAWNPLLAIHELSDDGDADVDDGHGAPRTVKVSRVFGPPLCFPSAPGGSHRPEVSHGSSLPDRCLLPTANGECNGAPPFASAGPFAFPHAPGSARLDEAHAILIRKRKARRCVLVEEEAEEEEEDGDGEDGCKPARERSKDEGRFAAVKETLKDVVVIDTSDDDEEADGPDKEAGFVAVRQKRAGAPRGESLSVQKKRGEEMSGDSRNFLVKQSVVFVDSDDNDDDDDDGVPEPVQR
jgi:hypothetical protein